MRYAGFIIDVIRLSKRASIFQLIKFIHFEPV